MKRFFLTICLIFGSVCFSADVTILHTSDVHGRISPIEYYGKKEIAGLSRRVTFVQNVRSKNKNVLFLDSGDCFQGSLYYQLDEGKTIAKLMPFLRYDAIALGNHEFDDGLKVLKRNIKLSKTQFISSNIRFEDKHLNKLVKPYIVKEFDGEKFLVIGITTPDISNLSNTDNIIVLDPVDEIKKIIANVSYDKLIVLSHCGFELDSKIAEAIPEIDLILGGHDHYFFDKPVGKPQIIHDGEFGVRVGVVNFREKGNDFSFQNITSVIESNVNVDKKIKKINRYNNKIVGNVVAKTDVILVGEQDIIEKSQTNLGLLVLKSMAKPFKDDFDGVLMNSGAVRINRNLYGNISEGDLLEILPFKNDVVMVKIQGKYLREILQFGSEGGRHYLQYYLRDKEIDDDKMYKIITNSYIATGKDGFDAFRNGSIIKIVKKDSIKLLKETLQEMNPVVEDKLKIEEL